MRLALVCTEFTTVPPIKGGAVQTHIGGIGPLLGRVHDTTIVCTEDPDLPVNELHDGLRYLRLPAQSDESYLQQVAEVIRRKQFDLVHVFNRPKWIVPLGVAAPDARLFLRVHNEMFIPRKIDPNEAHAAIERLSGIDTVSDYLARKIAALYPNARPKLRTIYTGVDLDRFQPPWTAQGAALRQAVREELAIGPNPVILFAGRLSQTKGPDLLLEAMRHVVKRFPRAVLLIVGSRWFGKTERTAYSAYLEELAAPLGDSVRFTGYVPALSIERFFAAADLFVCASQWEEPLARVHLEAMAAGLPIITTPRGGNPEAIYHGVNGLVVNEYHEPEAFSDAIEQLLSDPALRRRLGETGRAMAEGRFSWGRVAGEVLEMYDRGTYLGSIQPWPAEHVR